MDVSAEIRLMSDGQLACKVSFEGKEQYCTHSSFEEGELLFKKWERKLSRKTSFALSMALKAMNITHVLREIARELLIVARRSYKAGYEDGHAAGYETARRERPLD